MNRQQWISTFVIIIASTLGLAAYGCVNTAGNCDLTATCDPPDGGEMDGATEAGDAGGMGGMGSTSSSGAPGGADGMAGSGT